MKTRLLISFLSAFLLFACTNDPKTEGSESSGGETSPAIAEDQKPAEQPDLDSDSKMAVVKPTEPTPIVPEDQEIWSSEIQPGSYADAGFSDPMKFKSGFEKFRTDLVANNNKKAIADLIRFPCGRIKTREEFLKNYDQYFSESVRQAILGTDVNHIYRNALGAMVGDGLVWFGAADNAFGFEIVTIKV